MLLAFALLIIAHWANNQPTLSINVVIEMVVAILIIALLDHGQTEPIAQGLAWLFFVAVILSKNSPLNVLKKLPGTAAKKPVLV
jgi:hypothetical protein